MRAQRLLLVLLGLALLAAALIAQAGPGRGRQAGVDPLSADYPLKEILTLDFEKEAAGIYTADQQRVEDRTQAHAGTGSLAGEVTQVGKFLKLMIPVEMVAGRPYRIDFWARATNGTRLAVWQSLDKKRGSVGMQDGVPAKWTRYVYDFRGIGTGKATIEVVAPSAVSGVIGKMWIDDVRLSAIDAPQELSINLESRVEDFPALVSARRRLYSAWLLSENGVDRIQAAPITLSRPGLDGVTRGKVIDVPTPRGAWLAEPALAAAGEDAWLAYAAEVDRCWDVYLCRVSGGQVSEPVTVTQDDAVDVRPALCVEPGGRLWVAWESNREGNRAIFAAFSEDGKRFSQPERLSPAGANSYNASLCYAGARGMVIAYDSFRDSGSQLYLRDLQGGKWQKERRLTGATRMHRYPRLAARGDEVWVAWQSSTFKADRYTMNAVTDQWVHVARIDRQGLQVPAGMDDTRFRNWVSRPDLALDAKGRAWLSMRRSQGQHAGWEVPLYCYSGGEWSRRVMLATHGGRLRAAPLALSGDRLVCALQADDLPGSWPDAPAPGAWHSNVVFPAVDVEKEGPPAAEPQLTRWEDPDSDFDLKAARTARDEDRGRHQVSYEGKKLSLYWGDFHEHSNVSVCSRRGNPPPEDLYNNLRDIARVDFFGATDHGYNFDPYLWGWNAKLARLNHDPGRFVAFLAEEWTSSFVPNAERPDDPKALKRHGHRNIFWADPYYPKWYNARDLSNPKQIWDALGDANYIMIPHQLADTGNCPTDWNYTDEKRQPVAEIYQTRGSYEYLGAPQQAGRSVEAKGHYIQDAWARGIVIGVIASPDHGGGRGKAAVYAEELTREGILDAVRARHTYGTTGAKILLEVRVNGRLMGEKLPAPRAGEPITVDVKVTGAGDLDTVGVCRNNEYVYTRQGEGKRLQFSFRDTAPPGAPLYYYVRVIQKDGEIAWSSPVWLGVADQPAGV